jgi:hypothetical protein
MVILLFSKTGIVMPMRVPADWLGQDANVMIRRLWDQEIICGAHGKTAEPLTVKTSELFAIQYADENNMRRGILVPGDRVN